MSAPRNRYASFSSTIASSSGPTCGPHSLISVYEPAVGSTTAVVEGERAPAVEPEPAEDPGARDRARGHERPTPDERLAGEDPNFPETVAAMYRQLHGCRCEHALDERTVDPHDT